MNYYFKHFIFSILLVTFWQSLVAQDDVYSDAIKPTMATLRRLGAENKIDSIYIVITNCLQKPLTAFDQQAMYYELGYYYATKGNKNQALASYKKTISLTIDSEPSLEYKTVASSEVANIFFTYQEFDSALVYLNLADDRIMKQIPKRYCDHHSMLGYCYFIQNNYDKSLKEYNIALTMANKHDECFKLIILSKLARVYGRQKELKKAVATINEAILLNDSVCHNLELKINCLKALVDIYKENNQHKEALEAYMLADSINALRNTEERNKALDESEVTHKTKLKEQENQSLKTLNNEKDLVVSSQRKFLISTVIAILIFLVLSIFLFVISRQRNKINKKLQEQQEQIELVNKDLARLNVLNQKIFSVISHDFKGPILTLNLFLNNFKNKNTDALLTAYVTEISTQLDNANNILANLLNWAKAEISSLKIEQSNANLHQIGDEIIHQVTINAQNKNIAIDCQIPHTIEWQMPNDILRIVFRNMLSNAIKFSHENSTISIVYHISQNQLIISDTGIGMSQEKANKLFKQDVMSSFGTNNEPGFGMGLYIVAELLHKYKSTITVQSQLGKGTSFTISMPTV